MALIFPHPMGEILSKLDPQIVNDKSNFLIDPKDVPKQRDPRLEIVSRIKHACIATFVQRVFDGDGPLAASFGLCEEEVKKEKSSYLSSKHEVIRPKPMLLSSKIVSRVSSKEI